MSGEECVEFPAVREARIADQLVYIQWYECPCGQDINLANNPGACFCLRCGRRLEKWDAKSGQVARAGTEGAGEEPPSKEGPAPGGAG